jgi:hypothetical protein
VGTIEEVNLAMSAALHQYEIAEEDIPILLQKAESIDDEVLNSALLEWNSDHFLPQKTEKILKDALGIK